MSDKILHSPLDRPNSYVGRTLSRAGAKRAVAGRGRYTDDFSLPRMLHAAFVRSPFAHARIVAHRHGRGQAPAGRRPRHDRRGAGQAVHRPLGRHAHLLSRHEVGAAISHGRRPRLLGRRAGGDGRGPHARRGRGRRRAHRRRVGGAAGGHRQEDRARSRHARDSSRARRQPRLPQDDRHRRRRGRLRQGRPRHRGHLRVRPPHGRQPRAARAARRLRQGHRQAHHPHQQPVPAHDPASCSRARWACPTTTCRSSRPTSAARSASRSTPTATRWRPWPRPSSSAAPSSSSPTAWSRSSPTSTRARTSSRARIAVSKSGEIQAFDIDVLSGAGAYSQYPRTSVFEATQVLNITGGPYRHKHYRARATVVYLNKPPTSQYRAVGHPIGNAVGEHLVDRAARRARHRSHRDAPPQRVPRRRLSRRHAPAASRSRTCRTSAASRRWSSA